MPRSFDDKKKRCEDGTPICHFTPMKWESADNGNGGVVYFYECKHCGHTVESGTITIGA